VGVNLLDASTSGLFTTPAVRDRLLANAAAKVVNDNSRVGLLGPAVTNGAPSSTSVAASKSKNAASSGAATATLTYMQLPSYTTASEKDALEALRLATGMDAHQLGPIVAAMDPAALDALEADTYWTGGRMLSWVQTHFTHGQPGVQKLMASLELLLRALDEPFIEALMMEGIVIAQFSFQWIHCLLQRELPLPLLLRLWDTYLSLGDRFPVFHVYICAALVLELKPLITGVRVDADLRAQEGVDGDDDAEENPSSLAQDSVPIVLSPDQIQTLFKKPAQRPHQQAGERESNDVHSSGGAGVATMDVGWLEMIIAEAYLLQLKHPHLQA
jgi:hypothetical protein